jgi:hypothetical protein
VVLLVAMLFGNLPSAKIGSGYAGDRRLLDDHIAAIEEKPPGRVAANAIVLSGCHRSRHTGVKGKLAVIAMSYPLIIK